MAASAPCVFYNGGRVPSPRSFASAAADGVRGQDASTSSSDSSRARLRRMARPTAKKSRFASLRALRLELVREYRPAASAIYFASPRTEQAGFHSRVTLLRGSSSPAEETIRSAPRSRRSTTGATGSLPPAAPIGESPPGLRLHSASSLRAVDAAAIAPPAAGAGRRPRCIMARRRRRPCASQEIATHERRFQRWYPAPSSRSIIGWVLYIGKEVFVPIVFSDTGGLRDRRAYAPAGEGSARGRLLPRASVPRLSVVAIVLLFVVAYLSLASKDSVVALAPQYQESLLAAIQSGRRVSAHRD